MALTGPDLEEEVSSEVDTCHLLVNSCKSGASAVCGRT